MHPHWWGYGASPNVVYIGPPGGYGGNYFNGTSGYGSVRRSGSRSQVIYFGRGESYWRGYHFSRAR